MFNKVKGSALLAEEDILICRGNAPPWVWEIDLGKWRKRQRGGVNADWLQDALWASTSEVKYLKKIDIYISIIC